MTFLFSDGVQLCSSTTSIKDSMVVDAPPVRAVRLFSRINVLIPVRLADGICTWAGSVSLLFSLGVALQGVISERLCKIHEVASDVLVLIQCSKLANQEPNKLALLRWYLRAVEQDGMQLQMIATFVSTMLTSVRRF